MESTNQDAMRRRALMVCGTRARVSSGELLNALMPNWRSQYRMVKGSGPSVGRAGFALAKALGVSPRRERSDDDYRSWYYRADLEAAADTTRAVPEPASSSPAPAGYDYVKANQPSPLPPGAIDFPADYAHRRTATPDTRAL
jgi:hypothetical protein